MRQINIKGFTLLETLVSLTIISLIFLTLMTSFIKIDNENIKRNNLISLLLFDKYEYKIRSSRIGYKEILDEFEKEANKYGLHASYIIENLENPVSKKIVLNIETITKNRKSRSLILQYDE